ncbi:hypothetical protein [Azospirillum formosense]|uniref:hypothetical protein n=1 Tax=Azospirillum formosense TaxID=861533 RepID=UPI001FEC5C43|nr:hypothetical protein [Azospirillum formosense]
MSFPAALAGMNLNSRQQRPQGVRCVLACLVPTGKRFVQRVELVTVSFRGLGMQLHDRIAFGLHDGRHLRIGFRLLPFQVHELPAQGRAGGAFGDGVHDVVDLPPELGDTGRHVVALR